MYLYFLVLFLFAIFKKVLFILVLAGLGPHGYVWAFSCCKEQGQFFVVVRGLLVLVAFLVAEHGL